MGEGFAGVLWTLAVFAVIGVIAVLGYTMYGVFWFLNWLM
jgi:hypothetical protein